MTDHFLIAFKINKTKVFRKHIKMPVHRDKSKFCNEAFSEDLLSKLDNLMSSNHLLTIENFDAIFHQFAAIIAHTINKHAPQKRLSRKQAKLTRKPWIT